MFFIFLVVSSVVILFTYIIIKSFIEVSKNKRDCKTQNDYINEIEKDMIDPQNVTITLQDRKIEKLFTENNYLALDESEIDDIYDTLEIWMPEDRSFLGIHPLGIDRYIKIDYENIGNIAFYSDTCTTNFPNVGRNTKTGFDVGGAVVGTMIAGTAGTIIGGMHNMGKEPEPEYITTTNMLQVYYFMYTPENGGKGLFSIFPSDVDKFRKLLPEKFENLEIMEQ